MAIARHLFGAAASVVSLACAAPSHADSTPYIAPHAELVRFGDLNLDQPRDVARLFNRITSAADTVCGSRSFAALYNRTADYERCYSDTIAGTVAHIDRPTLTAYYQQRSSDWAARKLIAQQ